MSSCEVMSSQMERFSKENSVTSKLADDLDAKLSTSSKQVLLQRIEFKAASKPDEQYERLKRKYQPLNSSTSHVNQGFVNNGHDDTSNNHEDLPEPKRVLCSEDKVKVQWEKMRRVGPGLSNLGNTCYLNSVLQVLTYTAPLVNFLSTQEHSRECRAVGFCMMCELQRHVLRTFNHHQNESIKPLAIIQKLRHIAKHLRFGHQEDAHEFLRYVIDGLQKSSLNGLPEKLDRATKETTLIHRIFGGYYRSQVRCLMCQHTSNTFDPLMEVMLDVKHSPSIIRSLQRSCKPDRLDGDNLYYCLKCKKKVPASKQVLIHQHPSILTLQLKRFDSNHIFGGKVTKEVEYTEYLDLRPFMTNMKGPPLRYKLYAVLVHSGYSSNSGHYYCYVRASNNSWYNMNDSMVRQVGLSTVLSQQAYLLFYSKIPDNTSQPEKKPFSPIATKPSGSFPSGTSFPKIIKENDVGTPVSRTGIQSKGMSTPTSTVTKATPTTPNSPSVIPVKRPKLSFTLKSPTKISVQPGKVKETPKNLDDKRKDESLGKPADMSTGDSFNMDHEGPKKKVAPSSSIESSSKQEETKENTGSKSQNLKSPEPAEVSFPVRKHEKEKEGSPTKKIRPSPLFIPRSVQSKDLQKDSKTNVNQSTSDSCMTSPAKATTPWKVTPMPPQFNTNHIYGPMSPPPKGTPIPQPSPSSVKSDGSSSSSVMGKTGDWAIKDKNLPTPGPKLPERQHAGWTVREKSGTETSTDNADDVNDEEDWVESTAEDRKKEKKRRKKEEKRMKKKYQKFESGNDEEEEGKEEESKENTEKKKKKEKHKKKKTKKEKTEEKKELLREDFSSPEKEKKKKHKKKESEDETKNKRQKLVDYSSDESSTGLSSEHENTRKDHNQNERNFPKKEKKDVPVVIYDGDRHDKPSRRATWDGSRDTSTVSQLLERGKGLAGYGANVSSWEGGQSHVDSYDNEDNSSRKRRHDSWDEELDKGKVKKVKDKSKKERFSSGANTFQKEQDRRNKKGISEKVASHFSKRHSSHSRIHSSRNYRRF